MKKKLNGPIGTNIRRLVEFLSPMNISIHSAYTSFFLILSIFPILVILFNILAYLPYGAEEVIDLADEFVPEAFMALIEKVVYSAYANTSGAMLSVSVITALWSAGRGIQGLLMGLNAVFGLTENRGYFRTRMISMLYTFFVLLVLVLTLVLNVFGKAIADFLRMTTDPFLLFLLDVFDWRFIVLLALQVVLFTAMYAYMPTRRHTFWQSLPGAVLTSLGWMIFSNLFSIYVDHFPRYSNIYGSVYAIALAMLWLYITISIVFYGAALNRILMEWRGKK